MKRLHPTEELIFERSMPEPNSGCWIWLEFCNKYGYGRITINRKHMTAHRLSFSIFNGRLLDGKFICHRCDNPICVNPHHLYQGTATDNNRDTVRRGRFRSLLGARTHCNYGHPFSGANLYHDGKKRVCKTCRRAADKRRYSRSR